MEPTEEGKDEVVTVRSGPPGGAGGGKPLRALVALAFVVLVIGGAILLNQLLSNGDEAAAPTTVTTTGAPTTVTSILVTDFIMPDVVGMTQTEAAGFLAEQGIGFDVTESPVTDPAQIGRVLSTDPAPGSLHAEAPRALLTVGGAEGPITAGPAPWNEAPVGQDVVPLALVEAWNAADNKRTCSALAPSDPASLGADATPRTAQFSGGWGVAWDRANGPGIAGSGAPCGNCGRSAFGMAGTGFIATGEEPYGWPTVIEYDDGSVVGYGNEGNRADEEFVDAETGEAVTPRKMAFVFVPDQGCLYNVWSNLGEEHLLQVLSQLRFVSGLEGEPVVRNDPDATQEVVQAGAPPWSEAPLAAGDVPDVLVDAAGTDDVCPAIAFADLGEGTADATIRTANFDRWGVAWDNPDGPGRYPTGAFCAECGRGAFGIGAAAAGEQLSIPPDRIEWDDGSSAEYGFEGTPFLTEEQATVPDPETGDPALPPLAALLRIAEAPGCDYTIWSFLGESHLLDLLANVRFVGE